jgi:hypothetical protein
MRTMTKRAGLPVLVAALLGTLGAGCGGDDGGDEAPAARNGEVSTSTLNGTYHHRLTREAAAAAGCLADDPDIGKVLVETLRDGRWLGGETNGGMTGTYEVVGDRIVFAATEEPGTNEFTFERKPNGDLELDPVLPMDRGVQCIFAIAPWRRVGPPVRLSR